MLLVSQSRLSLPVILLACGGCSLAGTWKTVSVEPKESIANYPISMVTFDENNMTYTATSLYTGKTVTSTGHYDWNGFTLKIMPEGRAERSYDGSLWLGKTLKLSHQEAGKKTTATLEKQSIPTD